MEPVAGMNMGFVRASPTIGLDNRDFSRKVLNRYRRLSKNAGFIGRILGKRQDIMFDVLNLEYLSFQPWVHKKDRVFTIREFSAVYLSINPKIRLENYFTLKKCSAGIQTEPPLQTRVFQYNTPVPGIASNNTLLNIYPRMPGILHNVQIPAFIFQVSRTGRLVPKIVMPKAVPFFIRPVVEPGLFELPDAIHSFYGARDVELKNILLEHLISFSSGKSIIEAKTRFLKDRITKNTKNTQYGVNEWMIDALCQERRLLPGNGMEKGQVLDHRTFVEDDISKGQEKQSNVQPPFPVFPTSTYPYNHTSDLKINMINRWSIGLLDRERKKSYEHGFTVGSILANKPISALSSQDGFPQSDRGKTLRGMKKAYQWQRAAIRISSNSLPIRSRMSGIMKSGNYIIFRDQINSSPEPPGKQLSYPVIPAMESSGTSIPMTLAHNSMGAVEPRRFESEIPLIPGSETSLVPDLIWNHRNSGPGAGFELTGQNKDKGYATKTKKTAPLLMELANVKENLSSKTIKRGKDMAEEELSSPLTGQSANQVHFDMERLTDQIYQMLEKKIRIERERRGM